ncbi:uncharacterized protein FOMMEDRAFT_145158 [Fomitiporia mediterranea MF3/22]|uniref:uncharacterized protein n=1 Tax=Fomitiporia mediterranea (strain MF3/22) TaxID=694068 RepID=UPI0004409B64|nr:uncharacterized protein FOMMEDRAFT_145158 [Fomitiporia mediterranea MF3/22]EJD05723.1 hypothetical protein FOMMEDRAFT_145158 [Fomitiporia mediterranea MF3/22]
MQPAYLDEPPSYAGSVYSRSTVASPEYSPSPRLTELVIRSSSDASCISSQAYVFRSKHIIVNLGPKEWGTSIPVYGGGGIVAGTFSLSGDLRNVSSVIVKLEGSVTNTYTERGLVAGTSSVDILKHSTPLSAPIAGDWTNDQPISIPFPTYADGRQSRLPPSSIFYQPGVSCVVKYRLKITVIRKGFMRRNDSIKIPLLYLPRTFANGPLIESIPTTSYSEYSEHVKVVRLEASSKHGSFDNAPAIALMLPSTLSFAAYDTIPMSLSTVSRHDAAVAKLLLSSAKIQLIKRTRTWINCGRNGSSQDGLVGVAEVVGIDENREGTTVFSYELRINRPAVQKSWSVEGVAEQQYYIRVVIRPLSSIASHVPNYNCEQPIELTTDSYESPERELLAMGGSPSPALGTLEAGPPVTRVGSSSARLSHITYR